MSIDRRNFLTRSLQTGAAIGFTTLLDRVDRFQTLGRGGLGSDPSVYGPLVPSPTANTGEVLLSLPSGFQYNVFSKTGSLMTNGSPTPSLHDGMGVFDISGKRG